MQPSFELTENASSTEYPVEEDKTLVLEAKQQHLEDESAELGKAKFWKRIKAAQEKAKETETGYGKALMAASLGPFVEALEAYLKDDSPGTNRRVAFKYMSLFPVNTLAFLTLQVVLDSISLKRTLQSAAMAISSLLEEEYRHVTFDDANPAEYKRLRKQMEHWTHPGYKRKTLVRWATQNEIKWETWASDEKLHLGAKLLDLLQSSTGLVDTETTYTASKKSHTYVIATEKTTEWIAKRNAWGELLQPQYQPMVTVPRDWTSPYNGGYETDSSKRLRLVKVQGKRGSNYLEELRFKEMPKVYRALNAMQRTAWAINGPVLVVMEGCWTGGLEMPGLPSQDNEREPSKPLDIDTNVDSRRAWAKEAHAIKVRNVIVRSKRFTAARLQAVASKFKEEAAIYFPYTLDFRGRAYAVPMFLNPQANDNAKALLRFAVGKPIETQAAADWLAIHGANLFGHDKVPFEERVAWVALQTPRIMAVAADPLSDLWWTEADGGDNTWQFLAWCFEWAGFQKEGWGYLSSLPIALDGSCNGLQHFSAMLRDPVGAKATNVSPSDIPQDVYEDVAKEVISALKVDAATDHPYAQLWLDFGINRKTTKRSVMVLPYGGTKYSSKEFLFDFLDEKRRKEGKTCPFGVNTFDAILYLNNHIWTGIGKTVTSAQMAMKWLRHLASEAAKQDVTIGWHTPTGFYVHQWYQKWNKIRIRVRMSDGDRQITQKTTEVELDSRAQVNGISPNFVHSLDASAMQETICLALDAGIDSFAMIHDSYGTHCSDTEKAASVLRQAFLSTYKSNVLTALYQEMSTTMDMSEVKPTPELGTLDLNDVLSSKYFFA